MSRPAVLLSLALLAAPPLHAECTLDAYVRSDVPGVPVILSAPAADAPVIGAMPMVNDAERGRMGAAARIVDIRDGFAAVRQIAAWDNHDLSAPDGWVAAADLTFVVQTQKGFDQPDPAAKVVWQGDDWIYPDMIAEPVACQGDWVALRLADAKDPAPVWVRGVCGGQETTCDGVKGD